MKQTDERENSKQTGSLLGVEQCLPFVNIPEGTERIETLGYVLKKKKSILP